MKKVIAICLMIALVASISISVFAAPNGFVSSPSGGRRPPVINRFDPQNDDCTAGLVITPFGDKNDLSDKDRQSMEDAYDDIVNAGNLGNLNKQLADAAKDKNIDGKNLAVSDLFHLGCDGCDNHEGHNKFDIALDMESLEDFVGLIYRDDNGDWQWVPDAAVDGNRLQFTGLGYHPYAVVVKSTQTDSGLDDDSGSEGPGTGDIEIVAICGAVMAVSAAALAVVLIKGKKKQA